MLPSFHHLELDSAYLTLVICKFGTSAPSVKKRRERKAYVWKDVVVLWRFILFSHGKPCCDSWPQSRERPLTILGASAEVFKTP